MDGLIQVARLQGGRWLAAAILGTSGLLLAGTGAVDALTPASKVVPMGQEAKDLAAARLQRSWVDGSGAQWVEAELKSRSRVRRALAPYWSAFLMEGLRTVPKELIIGEDGWLFLRRRLAPPTATRAQGIEFAATACAAIERRLAQHGSTLVAMPVPRKVVACEARLPEGVNPDTGYDAELVAALVHRGVTTIDVADAWSDLAPEGRYLRLDSHWAFPGEEALADRLVERFPDLVSTDRQIGLRRVEIPAQSELLEFASIHWNHPVVPHVASDVSTRPVLSPKAAVAELRRKSKDVDVAVVGSSFTRKFNFDHLVAHRLGRMVYPGGVAASTFGGSLTSFAKHFAGGPFPEFVLYEFPLHQAFSLGRRGVATRRSLGSFFAASSGVRVQALPGGRVELWDDLSGPQATRIQFPAGALLSSGEGVFLLRIKIDGEAASEWDLSSGGLSQRWKARPGVAEVILPVLQPSGDGGEVTLAQVGGRARVEPVSIEVVTDADWGAAKRLTLAPVSEGGSAYQRGLAADLAGLQDVVLVTWEGAPAKIQIVLEGSTPDGQARQVRARFDRPLSSAAVLGLGPLGGGTLSSIRLNGDVQAATATLAQQLTRQP